MEPLLYYLADRKNLHSMLETFYRCVNLPIRVIDDRGRILELCGEQSGFCRLAQEEPEERERCEQIYINAGRKAAELGGTYVFSCHMGLSHIVFPLVNKNVFLGAVLAGPFLMKDPGRATYISRLVYFMFCNLIAGSKEELKANQTKLYQQSLIREAIQRYKGDEPHNNTYPYEREKDLIVKVKMGNAAGAREILNDLLGCVLVVDGGSLETIRNRAVELCSLLSRAAMEGGASADSIFRLNSHFFKKLQEAAKIDSLCCLLQEIAETFADMVFHHGPNENSEPVKKAILFISKHFQENISLEDVAKHIHLHPAYFSTIFKQSTGSSFREYINMVKIEEGKRLLANTDHSIIDIAVAVGFENQSYFSKVFKRYTGLTPKQFRS